MKKNSEVTSKVWDALAIIAEETEVSKEEMEYALEWFMTHYYETEADE